MRAADGLGFGVGVLHYRAPALITECLEALRPIVADQVVVYDNSPTDDAVHAMEGVQVLSSGSNVGYARAMNALLQHFVDRKTRYVLLLTQDARLSHGDALQLLRATQNTGAAIVGPLLVDSQKGTIFSAGGTFRYGALLSTQHRWRGRLPSSTTAKGIMTADWLDGAVLLVDTKQIGAAPFDESFFLYYEDVELGYRMRQQGLRLVVDTGVRARQAPGNVRIGFTVTNRLYFLRKHHLWPAYAATVVVCLLRAMRFRITGRRDAAQEMLAALRDALWRAV